MPEKKNSNPSPLTPTETAAPSRASNRGGGRGGDQALRGLILTPDRNTKGHDYTGAFQPEAIHFSRLHGLPRATEINVSLGSATRRDAVIKSIEAAPDNADVFAFITHGLRRALPQFGFDNTHAAALGACLARKLSPSGIVILYACSTGTSPNGIGEGDGGFADALRDAIVKAAPAWRGHVDAHEKAAHTTTNPWVRRFDHDTDRGGAWIVEPASALWAKWRERLNERDTLRLRFPFLSVEEIHAELGS